MPARHLPGPELLRFLSELRKHNDRAWFQAHKDRYESETRDPFLRLIAALAPRLRRLNPQFIADPSPVGGSMMRIYRDVRFWRDKTPFKTAVAAHFRYDGSKSVAAPALYLHLEPGHSVIGGGIWRPEPSTARRIRRAIVRNRDRWRRITSRRSFRSTYRLTGESLMRVPAEFDSEDPCAVDLKRRDFVVTSRLDDGAIASKQFPELVVARYRVALPFMRFLADVAGV